MTPIIYRSTDTSAPVLTGTVGALVALLDACLVTGYGSKSPAGWTKPFTATNKAVFRPGAGPQHYLDVNDAAPNGTALAREAECQGFETMSAVATGTQAFPAAVTATAIRKSATADSTARSWFLIADDRTFYLFTNTGDLGGTPPSCCGFGFGEFYSLTPSDTKKSFITGRTENSALASTDFPSLTVAALSQSQTGLVVPRIYSGSGGPINCGKQHDNTKNSAGTGLLVGIGVIPYPNTPDGGLYLSEITIHDPTTSPAGHIRGKLRGLVSVHHPVASFNIDDTFTGLGVFASKTYIFLCRNAQAGWMVFETTAWDSSA